MFKKIITVCFLVFFNSSVVNASEKIVNVDVNGLVCEFCAVTIEKNFMKLKDSVKKIKVDLGARKVFIHFKDGKNLSDKEITDTIVNNGYNVVKINR